MGKSFETITENWADYKSSAEIIKSYLEEHNWSICRIETLTENMVKLLTCDMVEINEHQCYFVDFGGYFGYSVLVFYNHHHIYYANDYQSHHGSMEKSELKDYYVKSMENKLYSNEQLLKQLESYDDLNRRRYYLTNYYPMRWNYLSRWQIIHNEEERGKFEEIKKQYPYTSKDIFAYFAEETSIKEMQEISDALDKLQENISSNVEFWKNAFYHEFFNYECFIGGRYMEAAYAATGGKSLNDVQKKAFKLAKIEHDNYCMENDIY